MRAFSNHIKMSSQLNEFTALYASYVNLSSIKTFDDDLMHEGNKLFLDENNNLSVLKEQMSDQHYGGKGIDVKAWLKAFDDWSNRLNLTWAGRDYECGYCEGSLRDVMLTYNRFHGYISLLVCLFGTLANVLNVAVLTRRDLAASINRLLMWLAVADVCVMVEYVPFAIYKYLGRFLASEDLEGDDAEKENSQASTSTSTSISSMNMLLPPSKLRKKGL